MENTTQQGPVTSYKGFDKALSCRGFQYEIGASYTHDGPVEACSSGFHACEYPLDVLTYYSPANSRFAIVEQSGRTCRHDEDSKIASSGLQVLKELRLHELIQAAIEYTTSRCEKPSATSPASATGDRGAASATGDSGAASATGDSGAASATGDSGAASATGYRGAASATGYSGAASATGYSGAASATGNSGAASATGYSGAASATGEGGIAMASGFGGKAMASESCAIVLVYRNEDDGRIVHIRASKCGENGIKPGVWYSLNEAGDFVEVEQ